MSYMHTGPDLGGGAEAWSHQKSAWWGGEVFPCTEKCLEKVTQKALKIKYFSVKSEEKKLRRAQPTVNRQESQLLKI